MQEHFECRNESLEDIVKFIDNTIISACDAHEDIVNFRHQVIDIFNEGISPELAADSSDALVILIFVLLIYLFVNFLSDSLKLSYT